MREVEQNQDLRKTVALVAGLNVAYFFVEAGFASRQGSVALFADSVDFLEDASLNLLILIGLRLAALNKLSKITIRAVVKQILGSIPR